MPIRLVVTDMDNTLYSWVNYIVPAVEAMVDAVCRATGFPKIKVVQSLKRVYEKYESNEYPYALQESSLFEEFPDFGSFDKLVILPAQLAFSQARRRYLQPFPQVKETLQALRDQRIRVVALTDAPRNPAQQRARILGLDGLMDGIYALPAFDFPANAEGKPHVARAIVEKTERGDYEAKCPVHELPRDWEKPDERGLLRICADMGVLPSEVLVVGDSLHKDVAVAKKVGALDAWAEYGTYFSPEYRERLDIVSADTITRRHAASVLEGNSHAPRSASWHLSNFSQVLRIIDEAR